MGFVFDWQKKLGYRRDPFVASPAKRVNDYIVDREEERNRLNLFVIKQRRFGILQGAAGMGKSTLLGWLEEQLRAHFLKVRVVHFRDEKSVADPKRFFAQLLDESLNILERTVTKPHEKLKKDELEPFLLRRLSKHQFVILVDEANRLAKENKELLHRIVETCPSCQVLLVLERVLKEHEAFGKDELDLTVTEMDESALIELLSRRIGLAGGVGTFPFDGAELKHLVGAAKRHPVKLLALARERAIELSLKVQGPPKPEPKKVKEQKPRERPKEAAKESPKESPKEAVKEPKEPAKEREPKERREEPKPKRRWFSIHFVNDDEEESGKGGKSSGEMLDETILEPTAQGSEELAQLTELVEVAAKGEPKRSSPKTETKAEIEVEDMIQSLVDELDEKEKTRKR